MSVDRETIRTAIKHSKKHRVRVTVVIDSEVDVLHWLMNSYKDVHARGGPHEPTIVWKGYEPRPVWEMELVQTDD